MERSPIAFHRKPVVCICGRVFFLINDPVPLINVCVHAKLPAEQQQLPHKCGRERCLEYGSVRPRIVDDRASIVDDRALHTDGLADRGRTKVAAARCNRHIYACGLCAADRGKVFRRNIVRRKGKRIIDIQHKKLIHFVFSKLYYSKIGCSGDGSGTG